MDPPGMVHALEIIRQLLKHDGLLIDIHPSGQPPEIIYRSEDTDYPVGHLDETDNFVEYQEAEEAIHKAVSAGWFSILERRLFIFNTHACGIGELKDFLEGIWSDVIFPLPMVSKAESMESQATWPLEVRASELIWITALKKN